jgi:serine protease inhibitor
MNSDMSFARFLPRLIAVSLILALLVGPSFSAESAETKALVEGNTSFALDLYSRLRIGPGNLFFSPYSISTCLAMTYAGARGDTEKQMTQVLHFSREQRQVHSAYGELQRQMNAAQKGIQLSIANALWAQEGHPFLPAFLDLGKGEYQANINQADFQSGAETAREKINRWVAQKTKDKIQDILPPGSLVPDSRLLLANAIYFKGAWAARFEETETFTQPFHLTRSSKVEVPLMHRLDEIRYMENNNFQAVELPYNSNRLSMVIVLPRKIDACHELEQRLNPALFVRSLRQMKNERVELFVPRFKMESSFELNDQLMQMGMTDAFGLKADFSGMDGTKRLFINLVSHKAWVEVNEEGTEAAAATAVVPTVGIGEPEPPPPPRIFRADHPFIFFIREIHSGSILFLGRLSDPSK